MDSDKFTKPGTVVAPGDFSVTEGLNDWVSSNDLVPEGLLVSFSGTGIGDRGEVLDEFFGVDGFTGTRITGDQHRLIASIDQYV